MQPTCVTSLVLIINLVGASLQASVTDGQGMDGGEKDAMSQLMCQGIVGGVPGIPGIPGHPGAHGAIGQRGELGHPGPKGNTGDFGSKGEPGEPGRPGTKGDSGLGLPGKLGSRGLRGVRGNIGGRGIPGPNGAPGGRGLLGEKGQAGPHGAKGNTGGSGVKGQKGERGFSGSTASSRRAAFTVTRVTGFTSTSDSTRIPFEEVVALVPGTSMDLSTGTFTCSVPGTYVFTFSVLKTRSEDYIRVHLVKNGEYIVSARTTDTNTQVSGSSVLMLEETDTVYLTLYGSAYSNLTYKYTAFSGFLLYDSP